MTSSPATSTISLSSSSPIDHVSSEPHINLIGSLTGLAVDEFVFLSYHNKWKGCGDFMCAFPSLMWRFSFISCFRRLLVCRCGQSLFVLGSRSSLKATPLSRNLCLTYRDHEAPADCSVGKGCWVGWPRFTTGESGSVPVSTYGTDQEDA